MSKAKATNITNPGATEPVPSAFILARQIAALSVQHDKHDRRRNPPASSRNVRRQTAAMAKTWAQMNVLREAIFRAPLLDATDAGALAATAFIRADITLSAVTDTEAVRAELKQMRAAFARIACFLADDLEFNLDGLLPGEEGLIRRHASGGQRCPC